MTANDLRKINRTAIEKTQTQLRLLHNILHDEVSLMIRLFNQRNSQLSSHLETNDPIAAKKTLDSINANVPIIEKIVVRNLSGKIINEINHESEALGDKNLFDFSPSLFHNKQTLTLTQSFNQSNELILTVNYLIKNIENETIGLLQAKLSANHLKQKLKALRLGTEMHNGIAFENGTVLILEPEIPELIGKSLSYFKPEVPKSAKINSSSNEMEVESKLFNDHFFAKTELMKSKEKNLQVPLYLITWADSGAIKSVWREKTVSLFLAYLTLCTLSILLVHANIKFQNQKIKRKEQKLADQQLNDERFKLATESADIGVWEYNLQNQSIRWDNAMRLIYGIKSENELLTCNEWLNCLLPQDAHKLESLLTEITKTEDTLQFNFNIRRVCDNRIRHIQARAKAHRNIQGIPFRIIGVNMDITAQRAIEDALREAEARFRSSFEWAAIGMAILDINGNFLQVNKALSDILGYSKNEFLNISIDVITHPQDTKQHANLVRDLLLGQRDNYQIEKRYIHKKGQTVWVAVSVSAVRNDQGRVIHFISQIQNITERKRNEAKLIEREHFLRTLSECLPGLVSYWGTDLCCHFANKNHEKWSGIPIEKMRGQHMRKVLGEDLFNHDQAYVQNALKGEKQRFERRKALPSGGYSDMLVHLIPDILYDRVEGFFSISTNITDFKAQQRELERINQILIERTDQAEAANKAKGAFLANMSHEIRTPMNAIIGLLQLLEDTHLQAKQRDYLNKISSAADVLLNVLNDILDISRIEANKLELSNKRYILDQVLSQAMDLFAYRADEKAIQLYCTKNSNCPVSLKGDRLRLAQILNNLLSNALKFTEKGKIHLEVKSIEQGRLMQFSVTDSGIGMNEEQCAALFKPFTQVDDSSSRKYGGAGLGLSICKNLVELMGGSIWVESTPLKGSTFHFTINCIDPEFKILPEDTESLQIKFESELKEIQSNNPPLLNKRVLVVDDHKLNRTVASEMLKKWGADVCLAENGKEAVKACLNECFDLVLMDLQMPEMDGYEATAIILNKLGNSAPPIVAVTASASEQDRTAILNAGMCEHVIKPFKKENLIKILLEAPKKKTPQALL
jgi:PAS domain S-box-containing protein